MVGLQILEIKEYNGYILYNPQNKTKISFVLEFYEMDQPKVGDILFLHESMLDKNSENFSQPYAFKPLNQNDEKRSYEPDYARILIDGKEIILIRLYG